jgi:hypothetical protein
MSPFLTCVLGVIAPHITSSGMDHLSHLNISEVRGFLTVDVKWRLYYCVPLTVSPWEKGCIPPAEPKVAFCSGQWSVKEGTPFLSALEL